MKPGLLLLFAFVLTTTTPARGAPVPEAARQVLDTSMRAMGGRDLLESIRAVELHANAQRNLLEQSIRPEGPWIKDMYRLEATLDFAGGRMRVVERRGGSLGWLAPPARPSPPVEYVVVDGIAAARDGDGGWRPYSQAAVQDAGEVLALNPLRVLLTADAADDLHVEVDVSRHGVAQHVLAWTWHGATVRLQVDANTGLPGVVAWIAPRPRDVFWNAWGDIDTRVSFENWSLRPNGLRFPTQWTWQRNGLPDRSLEIDMLALDPALDDAAWRFPDELRTRLAQSPRDIDAIPLGLPQNPATEIAPGIVKLPGRWDIAFVRQDDGLVVIDAPIGSGYSSKVLEEAGRRFPGVPVKAVVSTSDAWPHIAGLREYVARGIPIYVLDLNRPIVERLLAAPHTMAPDALQRNPREAELRVVSKETTIGHGANRIELVPLRSATGERQMLAWMPGPRLMYTSDLVQPMGDGAWYAPEMLLELRRRFSAGHYRPAHCFGMHYGMTKWDDMRKALDGYLAPTSARSGDGGRGDQASAFQGS